VHKARRAVPGSGSRNPPPNKYPNFRIKEVVASPRIELGSVL
jgi:hypothetical protein